MVVFRSPDLLYDNRARAFVVYVIFRYVASVLVSANSCDVLAYNKRLFDVTLVIWPPQAPKSPTIVYNKLLLTMTDDVCDCDGQITKITSDKRLLQAKTSQELTATNTEATYRWITTNARTLLYMTID